MNCIRVMVGLGFYLASTASQAQTMRFQALGQFPGATTTVALDTSGDGRTVVGYAFLPTRTVAWKWTPAQGYQDLGNLGGTGAEAYAATYDGSVIVGYSYTASNEHLGFRWTQATGMQMVPMYEVSDVSDDGSFMIGLNVWRTTDGQTGNFGFLNTPPNQYTSMAACSADGRVAAGFSETSGANRYNHAVQWTAAGGLQDLGVTSGTESFCEAISANGLVVVGQARNSTGFWRAFRRAPGAAQVDQGTLGGPMSASYATNLDGSVVVGTSLTTGSSASNRAFIWTAPQGLRNLKTVLQTEGAANVANYLLFDATGVSQDGRTIAGNAYPTGPLPMEPYIVISPPRCTSDFNADGDTGTDQDIEAFFRVLAGGAC